MREIIFTEDAAARQAERLRRSGNAEAIARNPELVSAEWRTQTGKQVGQFTRQAEANRKEAEQGGTYAGYAQQEADKRQNYADSLKKSGKAVRQMEKGDYAGAIKSQTEGNKIANGNTGAPTDVEKRSARENVLSLKKTLTSAGKSGT